MTGPHAVREEDTDEAGDRFARGRLRQRGPGRHHRIEQRKRQRGAGSAQERASGNVAFCDERHGQLTPFSVVLRLAVLAGGGALSPFVFNWNG